VERFVDVLEHGKSLYGLGAGCDEWRADPGDEELDLTGVDEADADAEEVREDAGVVPLRSSVVKGQRGASSSEEGTQMSATRGSLRAATADAAGRMYSFYYAVTRDQELVRLRITGRGGWSPAPDVTIPADKEGWGVIGTASYCVYEVEVRADRGIDDAVLVGNESWFLSRDACLRSRSASSVVSRGCPRTPAGRPRH
jgi:hypothetical protein